MTLTAGFRRSEFRLKTFSFRAVWRQRSPASWARHICSFSLCRSHRLVFVANWRTGFRRPAGPTLFSRVTCKLAGPSRIFPHPTLIFPGPRTPSRLRRRRRRGLPLLPVRAAFERLPSSRPTVLAPRRLGTCPPLTLKYYISFSISRACLHRRRDLNKDE